MTILNITDLWPPFNDTEQVHPHSGLCGDIRLYARLEGGAGTIARVNGSISLTDELSGSIRTGC